MTASSLAGSQTLLMIHQIFESLALLVGVMLYRRERGRRGVSSMLDVKAAPVSLGCLFGAGIGNKAAFWIEQPALFAQHVHSVVDFFIAGQSVVGGLLGGLIGIELMKFLTRQKQSTGDLFVTPILVGIALGRIGCFLAGLIDETYGTPTTLPWGVDFGDGVFRHPTQLYDIVFALGLLAVLTHFKPHLSRISGLSFRLMLIAYCAWRLLVDFIKPVPYYYFDTLSGIQLICLVFLMVYVPLTIRFVRKTP